MDAENIAQVAHEINQAYCSACGDDSQADWADAPDWQRESAINGVNYHLEHPEATPADSHQSWMSQKESEGWSYGPIKDEILLKHPCMVPYNELPEQQKAKDYLFRQVIHSLKPYLGDRQP